MVALTKADCGDAEKYKLDQMDGVARLRREIQNDSVRLSQTNKSLTSMLAHLESQKEEKNLCLFERTQHSSRPTTNSKQNRSKLVRSLNASVYPTNKGTVTTNGAAAGSDVKAGEIVLKRRSLLGGQKK